MALPIIIDCDPGHDDAIALVLALASPELEVKAITSSAGNQTPEKTLRNVLRMLTLLKRPDIPVAGGAVKPLMRELIIADNVHGESGSLLFIQSGRAWRKLCAVRSGIFKSYRRRNAEKPAGSL